MSKKEVVKAVVPDIVEVSSVDGYLPVKTPWKGTDAPYFCYKLKDDCFCIFRYTFSGRDIYSVSTDISIKYKILTDIMLDLMKNTAYEDNYKVTPPDESVLKGVGFGSPVETYSKDKPVLYISDANESRNFAKLFYSQVKEAEQSFILPAMDIKSIIEKFMSPVRARWPTMDLWSLMEHLVSYGIMTSDRNLIKYAFEKASTVLPQYVEGARLRYSNFIETLRIQLQDAKFLDE